MVGADAQRFALSEHLREEGPLSREDPRGVFGVEAYLRLAFSYGYPFDPYAVFSGEDYVQSDFVVYVKGELLRLLCACHNPP